MKSADHRRDFCQMIAQKHPPALSRRSDVPFHVLGNSGLRDLEAELEKLAMDAQRAPELKLSQTYSLKLRSRCRDTVTMLASIS